MKPHALVICAALSACSRDRDSLGPFDEARVMTLSSCDDVDDVRDFMSSTRPTVQCGFRPTYYDEAGILHGWGCACRGTMTLHRASNHTDARLLQVQLNHCPHQAAVVELVVDVDWLLAEAVGAELKKDLDEPGRHAKPAVSRSEAGTISSLRIYGDRVVEIDWSRDAFRQRDGSVELQPTESYFVAVRPREKTDAERVTVAKEPRVTGVPKCR